MACRVREDVASKNDENEDLLVFGYSCKLFRDDEKALYIDQGKHLIPWMGDDSLKIDRYDARGTLFDLQLVEAPSGGFDRYFGLTDIERQVESMCDEERYRALVTNEEEESLYQEEELKRLHLALGDKGKEYGQVEYKYDSNSNSVESEENLSNATNATNATTTPNVSNESNVINQSEKLTEKVDDPGEEEPFTPSPQLDLPVDMVLPETMKHNAIIEKTALFISNQGPQMEILLKMKQAGNPLFNFLSFDNPLHNYYRHLLMAIKTGRYKPDIEKPNKKDTENEEDDHYLHPSLASSVSKVELAPSIPSINYKPSAHCAYSMLVNKIKDKKARSILPNHLTKLKQALEGLDCEKKSEENVSGNESDSNCSSESKSSTNAKSSGYSNVSIGSVKDSQNIYSLPFKTPPSDIQIIIDKMASYVAKNGRDFETVVQMKKDPRFDFLNSTHVFHSYYQYKVKQYENLEKPLRPEETNRSAEMIAKGKEEHSKSKLAPVCFSIKKPKESETVIEKSALPVEESSDEEAKNEEKKENLIGEEKEKEKESKEEIITVDLASIEDKEEKNKKILVAERIKDKLTAAVREKVAMASKEKQLQLERKRRAAAFLKNLQTDSSGLKVPVIHGPCLPGIDSVERITDEDSDVASVPDATDDSVEEKKNQPSVDRHLKHHKHKHEKRQKSSRKEHREKCRSKVDAKEKGSTNELKSEEVYDRTVDISVNNEDNEKRKVYLGEDNRKPSKRKSSEDHYYRNKSDRVSSSHNDERRHKRKKHRRDDDRDRSVRKHFKSKRQRRSRGSDDESGRRSRRGSESSPEFNS